MTMCTPRAYATFVLAGLFLLTGTVALGDAMIIGDERELTTSASVTSASESIDGPLTSVSPDPMGSMFNQTLGYDDIHTLFRDAEVTTLAEQTSSLSGSLTFSSLDAFGKATVSGETSTDQFATAQGYARSLFTINFNLPTLHSYTLAGVLDEFSSGTKAEVILSVLGGAEVVKISDEGSFNASGELPAGDYQLKAEARATRFVQSNSFFNSRASFEDLQLIVTAIPEPGTLLLLAAGGVALVRRRR